MHNHFFYQTEGKQKFVVSLRPEGDIPGCQSTGGGLFSAEKATTSAMQK
jgi:hypothetical protein